MHSQVLLTLLAAMMANKAAMAAPTPPAVGLEVRSNAGPYPGWNDIERVKRSKYAEWNDVERAPMMEVKDKRTVPYVENNDKRSKYAEWNDVERMVEVEKRNLYAEWNDVERRNYAEWNDVEGKREKRDNYAEWWDDVEKN